MWISIFNAILLFAEKEQNLRRYRGVRIEDIISSVYPEDVAQYVIEGISKLRILTINQVNNGDDIGRDIDFENSVFQLE